MSRSIIVTIALLICSCSEARELHLFKPSLQVEENDRAVFSPLKSNLRQHHNQQQQQQAARFEESSASNAKQKQKSQVKKNKNGQQKGPNNSKSMNQRKLQMGPNGPKNMNGRQQKNILNAQLQQQQQKEPSTGRNLRASNTDSSPQRRTAVESPEQQSKPTFDFIVAGFPKCGTTTLLKAFAAHEETDMAESEKCVIASPGQSDSIVRKKLDETLTEMSQDPSVKRAFKCPTAMYNYKSLVRMEQHSPGAKFVVGLRHPVKMLQSFYNYRVTEIHERNLDEPIPSLEEVLAAQDPWKGVSMDSTRFELFLMQMGKTRVTPEQMLELTTPNYELAIKPTSFTVFLYTVDQLEDTDEARSEEFRNVMQEYLELTKPLAPFGHENKNHAVGSSGHDETVNICDAKWAAVRSKLVVQGAKTAAWLRDHFVESPDVLVANKEHFIQTLESWSVDPCQSSTSEE